MSADKMRNDSRYSEKRVSQWEDLMRKFSEAHKEECKTISLDIPRVPRTTKQFPTGSQYEGTWDVLGMSGYGIYTFPNGVVYEGEFEDGMFHGKGEMRYPCGAILRGSWKKGIMMERTLIFAEGLEYAEQDWEYCRMPDRRFTIEYDEGLRPAGISYLTADQPTRDIPVGYYDTGDGFYHPKDKVVYKADDLTAIIRSPSIREQKWIIENCRTNPVKPQGPRQDLYETWMEPQIVPEEPPKPAAPSKGRVSSNKSVMEVDNEPNPEEVPLFYDKHKRLTSGRISFVSGRCINDDITSFRNSSTTRSSGSIYRVSEKKEQLSSRSCKCTQIMSSDECTFRQI